MAVDRGRCASHQRAEWKSQDERRGTSTARGYDATWRRLRAMVLAREPLCRECAKRDRIVDAREVDHVTPIRFGGKRLDPANLQPLCKPCHSRKTLRELQ